VVEYPGMRTKKLAPLMAVITSVRPSVRGYEVVSNATLTLGGMNKTSCRKRLGNIG
jgi:hypothetical protein